MAKKKKKLRLDRVFIAAAACIIVLFFTYKGISFVIDTLQNTTENQEQIEEINKEREYVATVIIDPGHGGKDGGTTNKDVYEKDIALKTSLLLGEELEKYNIKAILTRTTDMHLDDRKIKDLSMRAEFSKTYNADYFISLHVNDFENPEGISGFEVYKKDDQSENLAQSIAGEIEKLNYSANRGIQDGKILQVLRDNTVPSVLIELGYIRGKDIDYLTNQDKLTEIAKAICIGIKTQIQ